MKDLRWISLVTLLACVFFALAPGTRAANPPPTFQCAGPDTGQSSGGSTPLKNIMHLYGGDLQTYPNEFVVADSFPVFDRVFRLYVSPTVSDTWSRDDFKYFISSIMDNDSLDQSDDLFPLVWNYFCHADSNPAYAGVRYHPYPDYDAIDTIGIWLYATADLDSPCTYDDNYCKGYSTGGLGTVILNASPVNPINEVLGLGFAHELQHICWQANKGQVELLTGYYVIDETLATLAEYIANSWRGSWYDYPYDSSFLRYELCDDVSKYQVEKIWIAYLYELFGGGPGIEDDLIYRWIRTEEEGAIILNMYTLAGMLAESTYAWIPGGTGEERLENVVQYAAVAKFCNAPSFADHELFGHDEYNSVTDFDFFCDNCDWFAADSNAVPDSPVDCPPYENSVNKGCWNVRVTPPSWELGADNENSPTTVSGIYQDPDGSTDYIDAAFYGNDYVIFRSGPYFEDGYQHDLQFTLCGRFEKSPPQYQDEWFRGEVGVWVVGYEADFELLQLHPEAIAFIEPLTVTKEASDPDTFSVDCTITGFGRAVKAVVFVVAPFRAEPASSSDQDFANNRFFYRYEYGVDSYGGSEVNWTGDVIVTGDVVIPSSATLSVDAGTRIRVQREDRANRQGGDPSVIEIVSNGPVELNGTSSGKIVTGPSLPVSPGDWGGFLLTATSSGGVFEDSEITGAKIGIESSAPLEIRSSSIHTVETACVLSDGAQVLLESSEFGASEAAGVDLDAASASVTGCAFHNYTTYGLRLTGNAGLDISDSDFTGGSPQPVAGLYVESSYDSTGMVGNGTTFENNQYGILYVGSRQPHIRRCYVRYNTAGIKCDAYSHPAVESTLVTNNGVGVCALNESNPDLGHTSGGAVGVNSIHTNTSHHVASFSETLTLCAQHNWWKYPSGPKPNKIYGSVDTSDPLQEDPGLSSPS